MMTRLSLKRRLTLFVASILIAITIILTSLTLITVEKVMVRPQIETIGIITFTSRNGVFTNQVEIVKELDEDLVIGEEGSYPRQKRRMRNNIASMDQVMLGRDAVISDMKMAQSKISRISIVAMVAIIILGVLGVYIMIDRALDPLKDLSTTIHHIGEDNLNTQIKVPQAEDEISSLIISFNKMLARLEIMFNEQKNFSAKAAHELRTPLTTMKTSLQVLGMDDQPSLEDYRENLDLMGGNIDRLIHTVNNLFLLSSDRIQLNDRVDLGELISSIFHSREEELRSRDISLDLRLDKVFVAGNKELLDSCLANIVDNAIKYNRRGGRILVELKARGGQAKIRLEDTGIGIEEAYLDNIFDAFYRVDENKLEGKGLGLAIVKNIVDEHQGEIQVKSRLGEGTEIYLSLPS